MRFVAAVSLAALLAGLPPGTQHDQFLNMVDSLWGTYFRIRHHWFPTEDELTGWAPPWRFPIGIIRLTAKPGESVDHSIAAEWWREGAPRWMMALADPTVPDSIPEDR